MITETRFTTELGNPHRSIFMACTLRMRDIAAVLLAYRDLQSIVISLRPLHVALLYSLSIEKIVNCGTTSKLEGCSFPNSIFIRSQSEMTALVIASSRAGSCV